MVYLNDVVSYVPPQRRTVADMADELELTPNLVAIYQKVYGLQNIVVAENESLEDLLDKALERLLSANRVQRKQIKYVFHCHSAPTVCPPGIDLLGGLMKKHGLQHAIAVGASLDQCATGLTALTLAEMLLESEDDDAEILILTGEIGFHRKLRHLPNTTLVGDAAAACLVGKTGERNALLTSVQRKFDIAEVQPTTNPLLVPASNYGDDLIRIVREALERASLTIDDISLILIHNVNTISWKLFARSFPCSPDVIYMDNVARSGHCFASDAFMNYCDAVREGRLKIGDYYLMVAVGTSSTFTALVLRH
jgi:3-oxoacyl-[acyl-carrier-protein] synthase III